MASAAVSFAQECAALFERQAARIDAGAVVALRPFAVADVSAVDAAEHNEMDEMRVQLNTIFDKYAGEVGDALYEVAAEVRRGRPLPVWLAPRRRRPSGAPAGRPAG